MQTKPEVFDIPLHDIKPLIEIQEYSMYYLIVLCVVVFIAISGLLYLAFHWFKNRNKFNLRKENLKLLNAVEFSDAKAAAYLITSLGITFREDSERHTRAYDDLVMRLEEYKYKKDVENLSDETLHYIEIYIGMLDV